MNAEFLLGSRLVLHLMTALILASYFRPEATFKAFPSVVAAGLLSTSGALAFQIARNWQELTFVEPQPQLVFFTFFVFLLIAATRGDVALLIRKGRALTGFVTSNIRHK